MSISGDIFGDCYKHYYPLNGKVFGENNNSVKYSEGTINKVLMCNSGKIMLKIALEDGTFFVSFHDEEKFGDYPFNHLFMAIDSDDIDDLVGLDVEFIIKNNKSKKTGAVFSNIKKIWIAE